MKGFTLIELLITIAIIGVLASIGIATFPNTQKLARDAKRKSDLKQYQTALENYANGTNGVYPSYQVAVTPESTFCSAISFSACPTDPSSVTPYFYKYISTVDNLDYVLWDKLESKSTPTYFTICSNGTIRETVNLSTDGTCPQ